MDEATQQVLTLAVTAIGSGGVAAILSQVASAFRERRRELAIDERMANLEEAHADCRKENADLREQIGGYRELNIYLRSEIGELRERLGRLERIESGTQQGTTQPRTRP